MTTTYTAAPSGSSSSSSVSSSINDLREADDDDDDEIFTLTSKEEEEQQQQPEHDGVFMNGETNKQQTSRSNRGCCLIIPTTIVLLLLFVCILYFNQDSLLSQFQRTAGSSTAIITIRDDDQRLQGIRDKLSKPHQLLMATNTTALAPHQFLHLHHMKTGGTSLDDLINCGMNRLRKVVSINYTNIHECGEAYYQNCKSGQSQSCLKSIQTAAIMSYCAPLQDLHTPFGWTHPPPAASMTILRHPVARVWSMYRFQTKSCYDCRPLKDIYAEIDANTTSSLSNNCRNQLLNHQTRNLMDRQPNNNVPSTQSDLENAMGNLQNFFTMIGLTEDMEGTFQLVAKVFPWLGPSLEYERAINGTLASASSAASPSSCTLAHKNASPMNNYCGKNNGHMDLPDHPDQATTELILQHNRLDVQLYEFGTTLFALQKRALGVV